MPVFFDVKNVRGGIHTRVLAFSATR